MDGCVGEESFQLWELNRRLEAYLARVKALEEQNAQLSAELGGLRSQSGDTSWRAGADGKLAALRALVDQRWREKHAAEVQRDSLADELEGVAGRCQQLRMARERSVEEAARSRRAVEAEQRARDWLSAQAADLERELEALRAAHEEERASLHAQVACTPRRPAPPRGPPAPAPEVEELARRLGEAWRGAVRGYQERVAHLESSLGQARERLGRAMQGAREGRLELQQLRAERGGLQERRAALEQRLEDRWQERLRATEKFQLAVEALEQEKQGLQNQIAQVLEGRQQLAHLKMSLSLEVATYRTLLEAENSRLQTPGGSPKTFLSFQDPKLELHFPVIPEGQHLGPVLSPTSFRSPLPNMLQIPVPAFLKSQEFLQARTPTLASTPIPPTPQAACPAAIAEARAQDDPCSLLPPQSGRQQAPEPLWAEAQEATTAGILPGPEEPGSKQQEASPGQSPEDQASLTQLLSPDQPSVEAKDRELRWSRTSSVSQEEGKEQMRGLVEKETTIEVQVVSSLQQQTWQEGEDLDMKEIQDSQGPLEKETLKVLGEEIQQPLMPLENQSHEAQEKEDQEFLKSLEDENLETLSLEKENQEVRSFEEKDMDAERPLEKEITELPESTGKENSQRLQSLEKEHQDSLETVLFPGKGNQELVRSLKEENLEEALRMCEKETQKPLSSQEVEDQEMWKSLPDENQESLKYLEDETSKDNQEPLTFLEENGKTVKPLEKEKQELLKSLEEEDKKFVRTLEKEDQESLRSLETADQGNVGALEKENQESLRSLEEEEEKAMRPSEKESLEQLKYVEEDENTVRPLEKEKQEPLGSLEDQKTMRPLEKENEERLWSLEEGQKNVRPLEKEKQEPWKSLEEQDQKIMRPLEKGDQELLNSLEEDQETLQTLEKETQQSLRAPGEEGQMTMRLLEKMNPEPLKSLGNEQETVRSLEKEDQELFKSLKGESTEAVRSSDIQNLESLKSAEEDLEMLKSPEAEESLQSLEKRNRETVKPLEKEMQETLGSVEENQEMLSPQEKEKQERLRPVGEWNLQNLRSPEEAGKEVHKDLETEGSLLNGENQELLRSLKDTQELPLSENQQIWEDIAMEDQDLAQEAPSSREEVGDEGEAELGLREQDGNSAAEAWSIGTPEPKEQRDSAEGANRYGNAEGPQDLQGPPEEVGAPGLGASQEMAEVAEPRQEDEDEGPESGQGSLGVTWESETVKSLSAAGAELGLEQGVGELEDQKDLAHSALQETGQSPPVEDNLEAESAQGLEGSGQDHMESALSDPPSRSMNLGEPPKGWEELEPEASVGTEEVSPSDAPQPRPLGSEDAQDAQPVLGPTEPHAPTLIVEESSGTQLQNEAGQEAGWGLKGRTEVLGKVEGEQEELGPEEISEDLQEEEEESRAESEADELGETLPDSTPLSLYLRSPSSPGWDMAGEERPSPQGEARKEGCDPAVPGPPSEEEDGEDDRGQDSDLSDEFEDLETEASLPGRPKNVVEPLGQVAQLLEPAVWDRDGESDGFADEESGEEAEEEGEEGQEPGALQWGPGSSVGSLQTLSSSQREALLAPEPLGINVPWNDSLQGAMVDVPVTAPEIESQDSAEPSGSEESDSAPWEEDQVPGPLETVEDTGPGDNHSINGDPNLEEKSENTSGRAMNGLEQSRGEGHGTPEPPNGDQGASSQVEEGVALKTPWAGAPVHLGPSQFLKFNLREGDGDSWSSGED